MENKNHTPSKAFILSFIVTHECNLRCSYCYESSRDSRCLEVDEIKGVISKYLNDETLEEVEIQFFGGEPWIKFELIKEVCEWVWSNKWNNKYKFFTTTNGTLVHGSIQDWLRTNKHRFFCGLSLDGTRETHNKNRCNSFDKIDKEFFLECWPEQPVKMTLSRDCIHNLYNDITYIHSLGFKLAGTNFAEGIDWSDRKYISILCNELEKLVSFYLNNPEVPVAPILDLRLQNCETSPKTVKWCGTGKNMAVFDTDGKQYPCTFFTPMTFSQSELAELKNLDFNNDELFIDNYCRDNCYLYNICSNCYGANYLANKKVSERDKSHCNLMKVRAYYASALLANKILKETSNTNKEATALQIRAIEKIKRMFEEEFA